jgi:hypothetical protein
MNRLQSCIFPQAVTPLQKLACVVAGVSVFSVTSAALVGAGYKWFRYTESEEYKAKRLEKWRQKQAQGKTEWVSEKTIDKMVGAVGLAVSTAGIAGCSVLVVKDISECRRVVLGTTQCCDIVRKTLFTCSRLPLYGGAIGLFGLGAWMSVEIMIQRKLN